MERDDCKMYAPNLICICVDQAQRGDYTGKLWNQYEDDFLDYRDSVDMVQKMDRFYDQWDFPQRTTDVRTFKKGKGRKTAARISPVRGRRERPHMNSDRVWEKRGDEGTFIVHVKYRQNSTWQGEVVWVENNERQYFRSALELLKLIDGAMEQKDKTDGNR